MEALFCALERRPFAQHFMHMAAHDHITSHMLNIVVVQILQVLRYRVAMSQLKATLPVHVKLRQMGIGISLLSHR